MSLDTPEPISINDFFANCQSSYFIEGGVSQYTQALLKSALAGKAEVTPAELKGVIETALDTIQEMYQKGGRLDGASMGNSTAGVAKEQLKDIYNQI